ncbi:terminus macrodomain insulation protein YfbV [Arsukibacterium sp.]|uniref:terminus macrodomain insulation protein YfbV n=1 Tax=Arsukibacterium sp. TaxID=1977258 RepID=UPI002FD8949F
MQMNMFRVLQTGRDYSQVWPVKPELNALFPENKIIQLTRFSFRFLPVFAVITAMFQLKLLGAEQLGTIMAMMFFLISLPLQGWYWLGVRASTPLPPALLTWCQQLREKMQTQGIELKSEQAPKSYLDLAQLLKQAYQQLDKAFIRQWF